MAPTKNGGAIRGRLEKLAIRAKLLAKRIVNPRTPRRALQKLEAELGRVFEETRNVIEAQSGRIARMSR